MAARRRLIALCLLLAAGFAALGVWQIERRAWKLDLIARVDARIHAAPQAPPAPSAWTPAMAYTRLRVEGRFLHDQETLVQAVTDLGPGWWVVTPLQTKRGTFLINRGYVPTERRDPRSRATAQAPGIVTVTGLARASEPKGAFLRSNDPAAGRWYSRDVAAIAQAHRLHGVAPYFIDADASPNPGGYPVGGLTVIHFRNSHLIYALTWFALCGICIAGARIAWRSTGDGQ